MADAVIGASGEAGGPARSDAGEGSEGQRAEVLAGKLRQIEEEIKIAIDHDTYGDNEMCMHGLYFDGRCEDYVSLVRCRRQLARNQDLSWHEQYEGSRGLMRAFAL